MSSMESTNSDKLLIDCKPNNSMENNKIKVNKLFRPWVTCHCLDCNINIDSKKLVYVMKQALNQTKNNMNNSNDNRNLFRRDSVEDSSDNRSEANSTTTDSTIIY